MFSGLGGVDEEFKERVWGRLKKERGAESRPLLLTVSEAGSSP